MITLFLYLSLALYLTTYPGPAHVAQDSRQPQFAKQGDAATGEVLKEESDQLQLNTRPCDKNKDVIIFRKPFVKGAAGTINCEGRGEIKLVQVLQK